MSRLSRRKQMSDEVRRRMIENQLRRTGNRRLARVVERNIQTLCDIRERVLNERTHGDRMADMVTAVSGSLWFVYLHVAWFGAWLIINRGYTPIKPFDPFPFPLLTTVVSLEAIFLSTFVLISQNRMSAIADRRNDLDLQIDLLAEYEITRILTLVDALADHFDLDVAKDPEVEELKSDVSPEVVLTEMERQNIQNQLMPAQKPSAKSPPANP